MHIGASFNIFQYLQYFVFFPSKSNAWFILFLFSSHSHDNNKKDQDPYTVLQYVGPSIARFTHTAQFQNTRLSFSVKAHAVYLLKQSYDFSMQISSLHIRQTFFMFLDNNSALWNSQFRHLSCWHSGWYKCCFLSFFSFLNLSQALTRTSLPLSAANFTGPSLLCFSDLLSCLFRNLSSFLPILSIASAASLFLS